MEYKRLEELPIEIIDGDRGKNYPNGEDFKKEKYCLFLNAKNVTVNGFNFNETMFIDKDKDNVLRKGKLKRNDIVLTTRGTVGNVAYYSDDICYENIRINSGMVILRCNEKNILPEYLYYVLKSNNLQKQINNIKSGSAQPQLPISTLKKLEINFTNISLQKKVIKILNTIDKKIELNNKINDNLYKLGKELFESYFDTEISEKKKIEDVCIEITRGYTKNYVEKSNIINLNQKVNKGEYLEKQYYKYLDEKQIIPKNRFVKKNDILLNSLGQGTLGRVHFFKENVDNIVIDQHLTIIRTDNNVINPYYLYYLLISEEYQGKLEGLVTGTTGMQMLNISAVRELKIPVPKKTNLDVFEENIKGMFEEININNLENENLAKLRDTLLPKLMNGEIDLDKIEI